MNYDVTNRLFCILYNRNPKYKNMKKCILILFSFLLCIPVSGQGKLVESSAPKRPAWVKKDVDRMDLMKVSKESTVSLNDARLKAFDELRNIAINSITSYLMQTHIEGADLENVRNEVINSNYVRNISEATAVRTYWEYRLVKKRDLFVYYILYDFNDTEKKKVALDINMGNFKEKHHSDF